MRRLIATVIFALVLAPAAHAWTQISAGPVVNTMHPGVLRTALGTELAAYSDSASTLKVWSSAKGDVTVASGLLSVGKPALVQPPAGPVELYAPATTAGFAQQGVLRWESSNDGASWSGPFATHSPNLGDVEAAAVRKDGTPMFSQDSTFGVTVYQGLNGEVSHTVFSGCCGYAESLAVDTNNYAQIAFWSNATAFPNEFVYMGLDGSGAPAGPGRTFGNSQTIPRDDDVPLVADGAGNTFMGWSGGYPTSTSFAVNAFQGGNLGWSTVAAGGKFDGGDPHMALAVDPSNRLWAAWTQGGAVHARRSRSAAHHFGAATAASLGSSTAYQLAALALGNGQVDAFVNTGAAIVHQTFLPGLTVKATKTGASVLDDGFGVAGATLKGGGHTVHTNASGKASLAVFKRHTAIAVSAAGYANTAFRKP
jgi:hypothetical protein